MKHFVKFLALLLLCQIPAEIQAEDGYRLWLRYDLIQEASLLEEYREQIQGWMILGESETLQAAKEELLLGLNGLLGPVPSVSSVDRDGILVAGTPENSELIRSLHLEDRLSKINEEGYLISTTNLGGKKAIVIAAKKDIGVLYGTFHFLRLIQTHQPLAELSIESAPKLQYRLLNHWDNLDRTVERGYAGYSLWEWHKLPDYVSPRYRDYARANASIGINGTVITNVNANALVLTERYLEKAAALADVFRPYGIKVFLTARFSAPVEVGGLKTADPLDPEVIEWWKLKVDEIYRYIPDFGGFTVKANSEGQPGPQKYDRSHADGANMLADALAPHQGIVMWRAFVYDNNVPVDRAKQAYNEFTPLDGEFRDNVMVQVKNGPVDFQPREPFHPLFGAMPLTPLIMEFQVTQEYLGYSTHLVYLAPLFEEVLQSDTHAKGSGSTVAKVIDGSLENKKLTGMAGVANIGTDRNWTGHIFAQSNWYALGRLAWDPDLGSGDIADDWIRMTFSNDQDLLTRIRGMMLASREITVNYMTPLGLHHIMGRGHHYGPGPWVAGGRADWTSVYYHKADSLGIGFDRSSSGSDAVSQYFPPVRDQYNSLETCPENLLLWFHHVSWDHRLRSGRTLWDEMCIRYNEGVNSVRWLSSEWDLTKGRVDDERYEQVKSHINIQEKDAILWRDACILYFQTFSQRPVPDVVEKPEHDLDYYKSLRVVYVR